jgi:dihydrolipoamide dehydrogenase
MYDLLILGGGPAGYSAAEKAGNAGLSTVLIEKEHLGGVCLNHGCIPSKALLHAGKLYSSIKNAGKFGVEAGQITFNLTTAMARKQEVVERLRRGIGHALKKSGVTVVNTAGAIMPPQGETFRVGAGGALYEAGRLLVCTGSEPIRLSIMGADQSWVSTSREMLAIDHIPSTLVVIGGGVIGLEQALFCAEAGATVTVIEMQSSVGGALEPAIAAILKSELEARGIRIVCGAQVISVGNRCVTFLQNSQTETTPAEMVLLSVGRRPVATGFGLEYCGIKFDKGAIMTDAHGRTTAKNIWAAGDVNGRSMLAHTAYREADVCVNDMLGISDSMNYDTIPMVIYTHPEVATVGLTEAAALSRGHAVVCAELPMSYSGRYMVEYDRERSLCKVVADSDAGKLLGVHMIGGACSEMIGGVASMLCQNMTIADAGAIVFPHPTVSEILKETLKLLTSKVVKAG